MIVADEFDVVANNSDGAVIFIVINILGSAADLASADVNNSLRENNNVYRK